MTELTLIRTECTGKKATEVVEACSVAPLKAVKPPPLTIYVLPDFRVVVVEELSCKAYVVKPKLPARV